MEPLSDPCNDRKVKEVSTILHLLLKVPLPPHKPLDTKLLFPKSKDKPDWSALLDHLQKEGKIKKADLTKIVKSATALMGIFTIKGL